MTYQFMPHIWDHWELIVTGNWRFPVRFFLSASKKRAKLKQKKFSPSYFNKSASHSVLWEKRLLWNCKFMATTEQWLSFHLVSHVHPLRDMNDTFTFQLTELYNKTINGSILFLLLILQMTFRRTFVPIESWAIWCLKWER